MKLLGTCISVFFSAVMAAFPSASSAQYLRPEIWQPNGPVYALATDGHTLYLGGAFSSVNLSVGALTTLDAFTGKCRDRGLAITSGTVNVVVPDGRGGWFLGGEDLVGGSSVAHLGPDGTLLPWNLFLNAEVTALAVSGSLIYVGGRELLAAYNVTSGHSTPWHPSLEGAPVATVRSLFLSGGVVYVAGTFNSVAGQPRSNLAAIDATTGQVLDWAPNPDGEVRTILECNGAICAGGDFTHVGGAPHSRLAMIDLGTGLAAAWNADADGPVLSLTRSGASIFAAGWFQTVGGLPRERLAMIDTESGSVAAWRTTEIDSATFVMTAGSRVFVAWHGPPDLGRVTCLDGVTGQKLWEQDLGRGVACLASVAGNVLVGNASALASGPRRGLAAIDLETGEVTEWNPDANGTVRSLLMINDRLYVGGEFTTLGGQVRNRLAAVSTSTGEVAPWNPNADESVLTLAAGNGRIFVGGKFWFVGGALRRHIAAVDTITGRATSWDGDADDWVDAIALHEGTLYVGGWFTSIGGAARNYLAALDAESASAKAFNAFANGPVYALAARDPSSVFVGGAFTSIGGAVRKCVAALDANSALATTWDAGISFSPFLNTTVYALTRSADAVWVAGDFSVAPDIAQGISTARMVVPFDPVTGVRGGWSAADSSSDGTVFALERTANQTIAAGDFRVSKGNASWRTILVASNPGALDVNDAEFPKDGVLLTQNYPNPFGSMTVIRFALHRGGPVRLDIFDTSGRRVRSPVDGTTLRAGNHAVSVSSRGLAPGIYWYRLTEGGRSQTRRMVVLK